MFTKTIQFLENCVTIFISARNKLVKETMKTAQQFNITHVIGVRGQDSHEGRFWRVYFWAKSAGNKECEYATDWTQSLELAKSWAEQLQSGNFPDDAQTHLTHSPKW
jgi:hypothetical protein